MFNIFYAKSVKKDIKDIPSNILVKINPRVLGTLFVLTSKQCFKVLVNKIKYEIEFLQNFPDVKNMIKLTSHPLADFRLRIGNYRVLFDIDYNKNEIHILKIAHRKDVYE